MSRYLGPAGRIEEATSGTLEVGRFLGHVPGMLTRVARLTDQLDAATRDGIVLAPETVAAIGKAEGRRNRPATIALWVIAALLALLVYAIFFH